MKLIVVLILLCMLTGTAAAITLPQVVSFPQSAVTGVKPVATFEGGQRFAAGDYPVIVLYGSYRQMGRQYGGLMKTELNEEYAFLFDTLAKRGYTQQQVRGDWTGCNGIFSAALKSGLSGHVGDLGPDTR